MSHKLTRKRQYDKIAKEVIVMVKRVGRSVSLPAELWEEMDRFKEETGISRSRQIELALRRFWSEQRKKGIVRVIREEGMDYGEPGDRQG